MDEYHIILDLANSFEDYLERDFYFSNPTEDFERDAKGELIYKNFDQLADATREQRSRIISEARNLVDDLRIIAERVKHLQKLCDQDHGSETYLEYLDEIQKL